MGKLFGYMIILSIILIFFHLAYDLNTGNHFFFAFLLNPENLSTADLWTILEASFTLTAATGIIIGSLITQKTTLVIKAGLIAATAMIMWDFTAIWVILRNNIGVALATILIMPLVVGLFYVLIEWWAGHD